MTHELDRANLRSRYYFLGRLVLDTALHIGGGREASTITDSPILRDHLDRPLIPGSSFKGAFRAAVERIVPNLGSFGFATCQLSTQYESCLSTNRDLLEDYGQVSEAAARNATVNDREALRRLGHEEWVGKRLNEDHLLILLDELLCDTCKTFGSVFLASVVQFHDLPVVEPWAEITQIRDGVGIDRDSERAVDQIKFDYEVVPAQTEFDFRLTLQNPRSRDLGLVALGLHEFINGMVPLGGIRSRGLGRCHLADVKVAILDFGDTEALKAYLTQPNWLTSAAKPLKNDFVSQHVMALMA